MISSALAQGYPERTVEITVPSSPGATADMLGRVLADSFTQQLGQRFIVVNKAAASGVVGSAAVAHAKPDGYTLLHGAAFSLTVQPLTDKQTGYTHKSFEPICQTFKNDQVIVVRPNSAAQVSRRSHRRRQGQARRPQLWASRHRDHPAISR